jgi:hypothetical protein
MATFHRYNSDLESGKQLLLAGHTIYVGRQIAPPIKSQANNSFDTYGL